MVQKELFTVHLEKGQSVTNGFRFPPAYQRLPLSLRSIVGKCLLPTACCNVSIKPTFLMTYCFVLLLAKLSYESLNYLHSVTDEN